MLGAQEWMWLVLLVVVLFGGKKIPEIAKGLGLGLKEFKKATKEIKNEVKNAADTISDDKSD